MSTIPSNGAISTDRRQLLKGLAISVVAAAVILVSVVLPTKYGIDPLGTGRALGLNSLRPEAKPKPSPATPAGSAPPAVVMPGGTQTARQGPAYRSDVREVALAPGKGIEIKTRLEKGAALTYSWKTREGSKVLHDFHGEPMGAKDDTFESFIKDTEAAESRGYVIAPFTGTHGWYWKNKGSSPVTIELQLSGFYTDVFKP